MTSAAGDNGPYVRPTLEPRIRCKWARRGSLLCGCLEGPGSLGDVHSGRIANALVADGFEAKDEAKGTNGIVGQALVRAGNQLASEGLTVGPAAGWGPRIDRAVPRPWTFDLSLCPSVIAGVVSASPPRMRAVWAGRRSLQAPLHRE